MNNKFSTTSEFLKEFRKIPYKELRSNKYKEPRESWCVATTLKHLNFDLQNSLISTNPIQADSVDIIAINGETKYKFQVVEIAPKDPNAMTILKSAILLGYSNLKQEIYDLVTTCVKNKEEKYSKSDKKNLNLLIYFNPPSIKEKETDKIAKSVMLEHDLDLDITKLQAAFINSDFGSILFLSSEEVAFLKNTKLV